MALSRRTGNRFQGSIWPGFVDAMTGLLLVMMFLLTIFMVVQFVLRETISGQETELNSLSDEIEALAGALGLEERKSSQLEARMGALNATLGETQSDLENAQAQLTRQNSLISALTAERDRQDTLLEAARSEITSFEARVAALIAARDDALGTVEELETQRADLQSQQEELLSEQDALNAALAQSRTEIDEQAEAARLAAARREALEALVADLRAENADSESEAAALNDRVAELETDLSEEEQARLAEAAAAQALRERLENADSELTAMTLSLEKQRQEAEDTLTLLAAARAARDELDAELAAALAQAETEAEEKDALTERLSQLVARLEVTQSEGREAEEALQSELDQTQAELSAARTELQEQENTRASIEERLSAALERLERAELAVSDRDELQSRLMAALSAREAAAENASEELSKAEQRARLLAQARETLSQEKEKSAAAQRETALLNQQVAALRDQLGQLRALLDDYEDRDAATQVQIQNLGTDLNAALARAASEERKRRLLEEAERKRLQEEREQLALEAEALKSQAKDLELYRSEFFGRLRDLLGNRDGVRIEGDRFVFSSEVLFPLGSAELSDEGKSEVAKVAEILREVADSIPSELDWVIRVDGHTDDIPLIGAGKYADNWELSQGRALSVVKYMVNALNIPPGRLSANGFGEYQPINPDSTPEARAQNRRIELKLTEK
ncbi:peptidoglycan -binding protein [Phaeobacter sp. 22II1-1F12B]|uniref:peptidoglycan -binding protein n=1 Tax=Phaeobacter sp. 22II1-1F12B TaxID=1317111 RepID=UPI000B526DF5|nr:peptidoglycan -binding protein [Phaeobacter sp. 22II1-1F12B]OWU76340.1 flagellar motor protein [Phaeobacter sp. 22II1-1F12B]